MVSYSDAALIGKALGNMARAKEQTQLTNGTGMGRENLYKALGGEGNPSLDTISEVMHALRIQLQPQSSHV